MQPGDGDEVRHRFAADRLDGLVDAPDRVRPAPSATT